MWKLPLLLVILGTFQLSSEALSYETECPPKEEIYPCTCKREYSGITIECSGKDGSKDVATAIRSLAGKKMIGTLDLYHLKLDTMPSDLFSDINIEVISIFKCVLNVHRPFIGLENSLKDLFILRSYVGEKLKLGHLQHLQSLTLEYNRMPELSGDWFEDGLPSMKFLELRSNLPGTIRSRAFTNLTNLMDIEIQYMKFKKFERSVLPDPAPELIYLTLDDCDIREVPEDILSNMPSLKTLRLRNNGIRTIDERTWKPNWDQLVVLDLAGNPIICDSHLNWMISKYDQAWWWRLNAQCEYPEELRGRKVGDVPKGKTKYDR